MPPPQEYRKRKAQEEARKASTLETQICALFDQVGWRLGGSFDQA
jgi:hypothetical protein